MPALPSWDKGDPDDSSADEDDKKVSKTVERHMDPLPSEEKGPEAKQSEKRKPERRRAGDEEQQQAPVSGWGGGGGTFEKRSAPGAGIAEAKGVDNEDDGGPRGGGGKGNRKGRARHFDEAPADDIVVIPDLEDDEQSEDLTVQVAAAPKNVSRKVPSLSELDAELRGVVSSSGVAAGGLATLDLSLLTCGLVPAACVTEIDETWDFDSLLQSVTQDFHAERDGSATLDDDEVTSGAALQLSDAARSGVGGGSAPNSTIAGLDASGNKLLKDEDAKRLDELVGMGKKQGGFPKEAGGGRRARAQA